MLASDHASTVGSDAPDTANVMPEPNAFNKKVMTAMKQLVTEYGGPFDYLRANLKLDAATPEQRSESIQVRNEFALYLWSTFPEAADQCYHHSALLPTVREADMAHTTPLCLHLSSFGYDGSCSLKSAPGSDVFLSLVERYLIEGFVTSSEPGWVVQPEQLAHLGLDPIEDAFHRY